MANEGENIREKGEMPRNKEETEKKPSKVKASYCHSFSSSASWGYASRRVVYLHSAGSSSFIYSFSCLECSREDALWIWVNDCYLSTFENPETPEFF